MYYVYPQCAISVGEVGGFAIRRDLLQTTMIRGITTKPGGLLKLSHRTAHTISTPMLVNLDRRWEKMSSEEQVDIQAQLAKRQEGPWTELTLEEKKASYFVAFGPHGPRTNAHPPGFNRKVFAGTLAGIGATAVLFYGLRMLGKNTTLHDVKLMTEQNLLQRL